MTGGSGLIVRVLVLMAAAGCLLVSIAWRGQYGADDTLAALEGASPQARCIVYYETGGTFDPNAVGRAGEQGAAQLHPGGLLPDFYAVGYTDPWNPYQAVDYLDWKLAQGAAYNWSPVLRGLC